MSVFYLNGGVNGPLKRIKHFGTMLGGVGRCWISVGFRRMLTNHHHPIILYLGTRHKIMRIFDHINKNVG